MANSAGFGFPIFGKDRLFIDRGTLPDTLFAVL